MDSTALGEGLIIAAAGMGLVFLALGLLMVAMWALERAFRPRREEASRPTAGPTEAELAAIAAAIAYLRAGPATEPPIGGTSLGAELTTPPGRWWETVINAE
jgi:Na+-transporting methylmalonyl-CoA/oxaloacetate decarboxylase gamma subunit